MRRGLRVWTFAIIGGLLVLLIMAVVACDNAEPGTTEDPTVPSPGPKDTTSLEPTNTPAPTLARTNTPTPTQPTSTPAASVTATPTPTGMLTPTTIPPIEPTQVPMPTPTAKRPSESAAAAIDALPWVQDDMPNFERSILRDLQTLATEAPEVFWELMHKPWMEEVQEDTHETELIVIRILIDMAVQTSETAALQTIRAPFLETIELSDFASMEILNYLARFDPDGFQQLLFHPTLNGGATDDQEKSVALLYLELRDPDAATAMENMLWVQDGITYFDSGEVYQEFEQEMVFQLFFLALDHRQVFWDLVHKPWMQDDLTGPETQAITILSAIANADEAAALQIIGMPFLDSMDREDSTILDNLRTLKGEGLRWLLSHSTLTEGITDEQRATVALLRLEWEYPERASVIMALPWVRDGIAPSEVGAAIALQELALKSQRVLQALAARPRII